MIWRDAPSSKIKKDLSIRKISLFTSAADRNRTGTGITTHGILSPGRLPVPPLRQTKLDGGGFEPPKRDATDLQSAPFGHSGTHP